MIKKVIFDVDDTIFRTSVDAKEAYKNFLSKYEFTCTPEELYESIDDVNYMDNPSYEKYYMFLKRYLGDNFSKEVFEDFNEFYINSATFVSENTDKVFKYLNENYEIVILSNWFTYYQKEKIKNADLIKYVKEIYGVDKIGRKPDVEVYKKACYPYSFSECVMIGDSLFSDILVPKKIGMRAIYLGDSEDLECISDINELLEIL